MNETEIESPMYTSEDPDAGKITMLAGGKVLFDETVGLQPVSLVEIPMEKNGRRNGRGRRYR